MLLFPLPGMLSSILYSMINMVYKSTALGMKAKGGSLGFRAGGSVGLEPRKGRLASELINVVSSGPTSG